MTLNVAQYLAPLNSQQVLTGYSQGVKQGIGISIATDGTITLDSSSALTLGFLTSSSSPTPVYNWSVVAGAADSILLNDGAGNVTWSTNYVSTVPAGALFPQTGAAVIPSGDIASRPASGTGLLRFNTTQGVLEFSNGTTWYPASQPTGGVFSFVSTVTPTANSVGDIWLDTNTNQEKVWNGTVWVATTPIATTTVPGVVSAGTNLNVTPSGSLSVPTVVGVTGGISNLGVVSVVDNITTASTNSALSANMGVFLQNQINAIITASNLTFAGGLSGASGTMTYVSAPAAAIGFSLGNPLPLATSTNKDYFVILDSPGTVTPPGGVATSVTTGDWFLSIGTAWQFLNFGYNPTATAIKNLDDISSSFNGVTTNFSLAIGGNPYTPSPPSNISVFLAGVPQTPGSSFAYTVTGSTITFSEAPQAGTSFYAFTIA